MCDFNSKNWKERLRRTETLFIKRNSTNFFKDRHWTTREFEELRSCREYEGQKLTMLEAGYEKIFIFFQKEISVSLPVPVILLQAQLTRLSQIPYITQRDVRCSSVRLDHQSIWVPSPSSLCSRLHPEKMQLVFQNINKELKPDRSVLFHDYGLYEHAMLRFKAGSKLGEKYYVRQ